MSSVNSYPTGANPSPAKRGRGRPRRVRDIHIEPIHRPHLDYYKLARALFGLASAEKATPDLAASTEPADGTITAAPVRPVKPDSGAHGPPPDHQREQGHPSAHSGPSGEAG